MKTCVDCHTYQPPKRVREHAKLEVTRLYDVVTRDGFEMPGLASCRGCHAGNGEDRRWPHELHDPSARSVYRDTGPPCDSCHLGASAIAADDEPMPSDEDGRKQFSHRRHLSASPPPDSCERCHESATRSVRIDDGRLGGRFGCGSCHADLDGIADRGWEAAGERVAARTTGRKPHLVDFDHRRHAAEEIACTDCHRLRDGEDAFERPADFAFCADCHAEKLDRDHVLLSLAPQEHAAWRDAGENLCALCHDPELEEWRPGLLEEEVTKNLLGPVTLGGALVHPFVCADPAGAAASPEQCAGCHRRQAGPKTVADAAKSFDHATHLPDPGDRRFEARCRACHGDVWGSDSSSSSLAQVDSAAVCDRCHTGGKARSEPETVGSRRLLSFSHTAHLGSPESPRFTCGACHEWRAAPLKERGRFDGTRGNACRSCHAHGTKDEATVTLDGQKVIPGRCTICHGSGDTIRRRQAPLETTPSDGISVAVGAHHDAFGEPCTACHAPSEAGDEPTPLVVTHRKFRHAPIDVVDGPDHERARESCRVCHLGARSIGGPPRRKESR